MPGPPPKHPSVRARRNDPKKGFRVLKPGGRGKKPAPAWPLQPNPGLIAELELNRDRVASLQVQVEEATDGRAKGRLRRSLNQSELTVATLELQIEQAMDAEVALWRDLWATPQAVIWEESHSLRSVAQYVRCQVLGEQGDLKAAAEARQREDRLGLNPLGLLRLRAEIEHVDAVEARGHQRRGAAKPPAAKAADGDDPRGGLYAVN